MRNGSEQTVEGRARPRWLRWLILAAGLGVAGTDGDLAGLGLLGHRDGDREHAVLVASLDPVGIEAVADSVAAVSVGVAGLGIYVAWSLYMRPKHLPEAPVDAWWYRLLSNKYYVDEFYDATVVRPITEGSRRGLAPFDMKVVDGLVNGTARAFRGLSGWGRGMQTGIVQSYALALVLGVVVVVALMIFV